MTTGERIRQRRKELRMTQAELAKAIGVTYQLISHYENNVVDTIPTAKVKELAVALHCPPLWLMEGIDPEPDLTVGQARLIERVKTLTPKQVEKANGFIDLVLL